MTRPLELDSTPLRAAPDWLTEVANFKGEVVFDTLYKVEIYTHAACPFVKVRADHASDSWSLYLSLARDDTRIHVVTEVGFPADATVGEVRNLFRGLGRPIQEEGL